MSSSLSLRLEHELHRYRQGDLWRELNPPQGVDFCSNDYLGLSKHPHILNAVKATLAEEGYGSSSSRFIRGDRKQVQALEMRLARFKQCAKAVLFSSGYAANVGVLSALIKKGDAVFSDRLNHASIIDGLRLSGADIGIFSHLDVEDLHAQLAQASPQQQKFIVTESLFSMDGDIAPLDRYADLARKFDAALIVDEAHGLGLYGKAGAGLIDHFGVGESVTLSINGLGKAFGCYGAVVAGSEMAIDYVTQRARTLMYSTALPPLAISAIDAALDLVLNGDELRADLFSKASLYPRLLPVNVGYGLLSPIIPVVIGDNGRALIAAKRLQEAGFDIRAIRPPSVPNNGSRLRITVNVSQTKDLIESLLHSLQSLL